MSSGATYLSDINESLQRISNPESIDVVIYNAGMDPHEHCRIGGSPGITTEILRQREEIVFRWARLHSNPVAYVFAGGYEGGQLTRQELIQLHRSTIETCFRQDIDSSTSSNSL